MSEEDVKQSENISEEVGRTLRMNIGPVLNMVPTKFITEVMNALQAAALKGIIYARSG